MEDAVRNLTTSTERTGFKAFVEAVDAMPAFETTEQIARRRVDEMLMDSFPASDPISSLQLA
jgi:hypothetical protein